jgi:hypothetical protein
MSASVTVLEDECATPRIVSGIEAGFVRQNFFTKISPIFSAVKRLIFSPDYMPVRDSIDPEKGHATAVVRGSEKSSGDTEAISSWLPWLK